jgi:hypothetical protein
MTPDYNVFRGEQRWRSPSGRRVLGGLKHTARSRVQQRGSLFTSLPYDGLWLGSHPVEGKFHMFLFKTSGKTFNSVIKNQKHAFVGKPKDWHVGELVLVSKNKADCQYREKQVQYTMTLRDIRLLLPGEAERYWPGNERHWKYLIVCDGTAEIRPFNLEDVLGDEFKMYSPIMTFKKILPRHEKMIAEYLRNR